MKLILPVVGLLLAGVGLAVEPHVSLAGTPSLRDITRNYVQTAYAR